MVFLKKLSVAIISFLILTSYTVTPLFAQDNYHSGETITLSANQIIEGNYFAAGETLIIAGTINGDAYLAGGVINIDGTINGDLLVAGGNITITGTVTGNIRTAGGNISISGITGRNITAVGGSIDIENSAQVAGSLVTAGGNIQIFAPIPQSITAGAGRLYVANNVGGGIVAGVGDLTIAPSANIQGDILYYSDKEAKIDPTASIAGEVTHRTPPQRPQVDTKPIQRGFIAGITIFGFLSSLLMGLLLVWVLPATSQQIANRISTQPLWSLVLGFILLIITPIAAVLLMVTVLAIPLGIILFVMYGISLYLAHLFTAIIIGQQLYPSISQTPNPYFSFIVGLVILTLASLVPFIGGFISFIGLLLGLGGIGLVLKNFSQTPAPTKASKTSKA